MYLEILCQCWTDCKTFYRSCATFLPSFEEMNFPTRQNHNVKTKSYQHLCKVASLRRRLYDVFSQLHYACLDLSHDTKIPAWPVLWPMMIRSACASVHIKGTFFCWKSKADRRCLWIEKALNSPNLRWPNISKKKIVSRDRRLVEMVNGFPSCPRSPSSRQTAKFQNGM